MATGFMLYTVNAADVQEGDSVDILGIVSGEVVKVEDLGTEIVIHLRDEEEFGETVAHTLDPFDEVDILATRA